MSDSGLIIVKRASAADLRVRPPLLLARDSDKKPKFVCLLCHERGVRTVFYEDEMRAYERHVVAHDEHDVEALRQRTSMRAKAPELFDPQVAGDVELFNWIHENREAIIEGRVFPSGTGSSTRNRRRGRSRP